ncbi:hypothetical protein QVD17_15184 [Tagetes erecta]|uniref:Uncharacterized protein n=1 Tax=Tagetes erecta TaxID=13708 RepID=A0AAD8NSE2_TARER|nr:hypothetical protein QVD17_15184 [Tagetes erecta]
MLNMSSSSDFAQKPLKIKQDDKFFSKLVSKETSIANPSFRVYYGNVSGSVPFTWEIQPGTPKHKFSDNSLPPLTPPPSYYFTNPNHHHQTKPSKRKYYPRSKFLYNLLFNINAIKKRHVSPSSLSSSSWSSSMSSANASSKGFGSRRRRFRSFGSSFDDGNMYHGGSSSSSSGGGSFTVVIMKKAWLSIVGRRSV